MRSTARFSSAGLIAAIVIAAGLATAPVQAATINVPADIGTIQAAIDAASPGDVIQVAVGTYVEQLDIPKDITLQGANMTGVVIQSPATLVQKFALSSGVAKPVVCVHDATVTIRTLTIDGAGLGHDNNRFMGLAFHNAGGTVDHARITGIREDPLNGNQNGDALYVYNEDLGARTLTLTNNTVLDYQKGGMVLRGSGLTADIEANTVTGPGGANGPAANGIQVSDGVLAAIRENEVSHNGDACSNCGPDPMVDWQSAGILVLGASGGTLVEGNQVHANDVGIWAESGGSVTVSENLGVGNRYAGISVNGSSYTIIGNHVTTNEPGSDGVWVLAFNSVGPTTATIEDNCLTGGNTGNGVLARTEGAAITADVRNSEIWLWDNAFKTVGANASLDAADCKIHDNEVAGFDNGGGHAQMATMNWWGDATGPGGAGPGSGDEVLPSVSPGVTFSPWRTNDADLNSGCPFEPVENMAGGEAPATCLTPEHTCVTIPVRITRGDNAPMRGYSVTFGMSPELALCTTPFGSITQGTYLSSAGSTHFEVLDNQDGSYTVDCAILGSTSGATAPTGILFNISVRSAVSGETAGFMTLTSLTFRDINNAPIPGSPGPPAAVTVDNVSPAAVTDLAASQVLAGNGSDGRTGITLTFTPPGDAATVEVYRAPYGTATANAYPEYDDVAGAGAPAAPSYPPGGLWTLTGITASGQTDEPPERGFWYYVIFSKDACGNASAVSNRTAGALDYHLGDTHDGHADCAGDNLVNTTDVSFLGSHYGAHLGDPDALACLDVGPTADFSVHALPLTDNVIGFEDLMIFSMNYLEVGLNGPPPAAVPGERSGRPVLALTFEPPNAAGVTTAHLMLKSNPSSVKGVHALIAFDRERIQVTNVQQGTLLQNAFFAHLGDPAGLVVDAAVLGQDQAIAGDGELARIRFRAGTARPSLTITTADLRDVHNRFLGDRPEGVAPVPLAEEAQPETPAGLPQTLELLGARPNPFMGTTGISFRLPSAMTVSLRIFDAGGRLLRSLADGPVPAGEHTLAWDGRNAEGQRVGAGVYFYTFRAGETLQTRKLFLYR